MADSGSISDGSVGFFTKTGELKSKQQNSEAKTKIEDATSSATPTEEVSQGSDNATKFSDAIAAVEERVTTSVSRVANVINVDTANLKAARKQVKDEISVLKDMRAALEDGSKADYSDLRAKYEKISTKRADLSAQISADNKEFAADRVVGIRLGNRTEATFNVEAPTFSAQSSDADLADLKDKKQITKMIKEKESELDSLREQTKSVKEQKKSLSEVSAKLTAEIRGVESRTLKSFDEASSLSKKIAGAISSGGVQLFEQASLSNLRTSVSMKLIS